MKKIVLILFLCASVSLFADEQPEVTRVDQSYGYYAFGVGFPLIFSIDVGKRVQHNHVGWEAGIGVVPFIIINEVHVYFSNLYYPRPNLKSQYYLGISAEFGHIFDVFYNPGSAPLFTPKLLLGKEFTTKKNKKRFIQINLGAAHLTRVGVRIFPDISLKYAIEF